jgi:drug/metabolite transporter (DMT)-like permease
LLGLLLAVTGLAIIFAGGAGSGPHVGVGVVAVLLSTTLHAASSVWVKRLSADLPAMAVTGGGLSVAVPAFVLTWFVFDGVWPQSLPDRSRFAITYLALFGSVLGFFWYYYLLRRVAAVKVNLITLVTPVTALLLGHWLNDEAILPTVWLGSGLMLGGLAMHQWQLMGGRAQDC